jgi:hypothetical protein
MLKMSVLVRKASDFTSRTHVKFFPRTPTERLSNFAQDRLFFRCQKAIPKNLKTYPHKVEKTTLHSAGKMRNFGDIKKGMF